MTYIPTERQIMTTGTPKIDGSERVTGHHIALLNQQFNAFDMQQLLGMLLAKLANAVTPKNIDNPIGDVTRSLVIRYLLAYPDNAPLPKLFGYSELADLMESVPDGFPLPNKESKIGAWIGRSVSTAHKLRNNNKTVRALQVWITMLINNFDDIIKMGDKHPLLQIMNEEAAARGITLREIEFHKGWPRDLRESQDPDLRLMCGRDIAYLSETFDYLELQGLIGIYMSKMTQLTNARNRDIPVNDITQCLIIRTLIKHPEFAPRAELMHYQDLVDRLDNMPKNEVFPKLLPSNSTNIGVLFGRSVSTALGLKKGRKEMLVISVWITILLNHFEELLDQGEAHPLYKIMEDEALSRDLTLKEVIFNRGWPSSR